MNPDRTNQRRIGRWSASGATRLAQLAALAFLVGTGSPVAMAQQSEPAGPATLQSVDVTTLPGNKVQVRFQFDREAESPRAFTVNQPARIVLDFMGTENGANLRQKPINQGVAERINLLEGADRTRASINLARLVPYSVKVSNRDVLLTLDTVESAPATASSPTARAAAGSAASQQPSAITNVDFRRSAQGAAIIGIELTDPNIDVDVRLQGTQIIADFRGASLTRDQQRRLDVTDFATPVTLVDASNTPGGAQIAIEPTGRYEYLAYQTDNLYTIEVKPVQPDEEESRDPSKKEYTGELLSLNFQDIEVRAVLQIIADFTGLNVVVSDTVQGNLTLRLQNVPWDQALDIILTTKGLTARQNGNVIYVAPTEEITARERLELEAQKQVTELIPVQTELMQVNYAKAEDIATIVRSQGGGGGGGEGGAPVTLLSARGSISVDPRTNTLLVQDTPDRLSDVRRLVAQLDRPVRQVMIDSRIVIANDDFTKELGVRYGFAGVQSNGENGLISLTGSASGNNTVVNSALANIRGTGQPFPTAAPSLSDRLGVNLGAAEATSRVALAILGQDYLLDLELSALQAEGRGEILSNPRVITTDRKAAVIRQGREVPYQERSGDGEVTISFKEALLELNVTPQITPDNRVIMDLIVTKNEVGELIADGLGGFVPTIDRREVQTQVLVNNGETVVLGGVFEQLTFKDVDKVPFLGDLPGIGNLFKKTRNQNTKLELLIFVTPQIVTGGLAQR